MLAVSLAVTAVPVLAGILRDRRMENTRIGRLAMTSAVAIDAVTWVVLAVAIGLATGQDGAVKAVTVLLCGIPAVLAVRWIARTKALETLASRYPYAAMILVAVIAYAASQTTRGLGLTEIFGAVLVGFALPGDGAWARVSHQLGRLGRLLLPVIRVLPWILRPSGRGGNGTPAEQGRQSRSAAKADRRPPHTQPHGSRPNR
ncbi:cation:proton antiporter [Micromonospora sp. Llam0]|uniref:cation:proton antiporter domain-containing protein n=1 Tax=Micromonospora sp. Llam0 TaxID=2485143 RepID=UPI000F48D5DA|nr:cation:proton antiporter [Micromonospora sp. Llam0]